MSLCLYIFAMFIAQTLLAQEPSVPQPATPAEDARVVSIQEAARLIDLEFSTEEARMMRRGVENHRRALLGLRASELANSVAPASGFRPLPIGAQARVQELAPREQPQFELERPADLDSLAFADIETLSALLKQRRVSCEELVRSTIERLERIDTQLHCVIQFTKERALATARLRDRELEQGLWRGPLHGIPYGAKDLFAARGAATTWGAEPFREQHFDIDATVIARLEEAGAVLIAKLSLGALAMGDVWFGGQTLNPWDLNEGSSGSSAGSAAAVAAGGVVFAIGTETLGSIVSPSVRCGCTALRPSFGRVSRCGAMALSWSMDKVGPMARSFQDVGIVLEAIAGKDDCDADVVDGYAFRAPARTSVAGWKIGYPRTAYPDGEAPILNELRALGVELVPLEWPAADYAPLRLILEVEAAAAFDELTRSGRDDLLKRQTADAWPNLFRTARLIPAVEYVQAQRMRTVLVGELHRQFEGLVAIVHPPFWNLLAFNLSGHPTAVAPYATAKNGKPSSIAFTGQLYDEARLLALAEAWQASGNHHRQHPPRR